MKKSIFVISLVILFQIFCLSFAGMISASFVSYQKPVGKAVPSEKKIYQKKEQPSPSPKPLLVKKKPVASLKTQPAISPTPNPSEVIETSKQETQQVTPIIPMLRVSVAISNSPAFDISISDGANQCDVLTKALSEGRISSLNMRFDQNYGSFAVYQINGIGKENNVWWVYEVNGQKLSQGCSFIRVKDADKVEWKYLGS